ncbi:glutaredoxin 3 [Niveibacterium sp.]|uniref:glutaredoxin 3 n=1 Tax=Niveibacterium sp. TaxID=2017444 RepID=UPI0035AF75B0
MDDITVYSGEHCPFCTAAKSLLDSRGLRYTEIKVSEDPVRLHEMIARSQRRTVPQIFFGERHIGGFDDLQAHFGRQG